MLCQMPSHPASSFPLDGRVSSRSWSSMSAPSATLVRMPEELLYTRAVAPPAGIYSALSVCVCFGMNECESERVAPTCAPAFGL